MSQFPPVQLEEIFPRNGIAISHDEIAVVLGAQPPGQPVESPIESAVPDDGS